QPNHRGRYVVPRCATPSGNALLVGPTLARSRQQCTCTAPRTRGSRQALAVQAHGRRRGLQRTAMYILIGGGGQVGYYLAKALQQQEHEVVLLEKNAARVRQLAEEIGASVTKGDACEARVLADVGCERADLVVAVTGEDEDNLVICQMAKAKFKV